MPLVHPVSQPPAVSSEPRAISATASQAKLAGPPSINSTFVNELGHFVTLSVQGYSSISASHVLVTAASGSALTSHLWTRAEAAQLRDLLTQLLDPLPTHSGPTPTSERVAGVAPAEENLTYSSLGELLGQALDASAQPEAPTPAAPKSTFGAPPPDAHQRHLILEAGHSAKLFATPASALCPYCGASLTQLMGDLRSAALQGVRRCHATLRRAGAPFPAYRADLPSGDEVPNP